MKRTRYLLKWSLSAAIHTPDADIRMVLPSDRKALADLMYAAYKGTPEFEGESLANARIVIDDIFANGNGTLLPACSFAAEFGGHLCAAVIITLEPRTVTPFVSYVLTHPACRRQGYAARLLQAAAGALRRKGFNELSLRVTEDNIPALRLYNSLGFTSVDAVAKLV